MPNTSRPKMYRWIFGTMLVAAIAAFLASFTLSTEKLTLLENPNATLSCSINPILNCASVMKTPQASVFGFPNSYLGIMGFAIVMTVAMGGLLGNRQSRAFMLSAQAGYGLGLVFAYWLFLQSVYVIQILCPWCLVVTTATTIIFAALLHYNLRENNFRLKEAQQRTVINFLDKGYGIFGTVLLLTILVALVILQFGADLLAM